MKILSKMSIVLFVLLLAMTVGSVSIIRDLARELEQATWTSVQSAREADAAACDERLAGIRLSEALSRLDARHRWLAARLAWLARDDALERAMADTSGEVYAPLLAARMAALDAEISDLWLVRPDGSPIRVVQERDRRRGTSRRDRNRNPGPASLPEELRPLASRVMEGVVAFDIFPSSDKGRDSAVAETARDGGGERGAGALLVLGVPVHSAGNRVAGAVFGSLDLGVDTLVAPGSARSAGAIRGLAVSVERERRLVLGEGFDSEARVPEAVSAALQEKKRFVRVSGATVEVAAAIDWPGAPGLTAIELSVARGEPGSADRQGLTAGWARPLRRASGLEALMAVLALALGIEGARRATRPLNRLLKRAELVSTGKVDASFKDLSGRNEVGELARCFERMRISIHKLMDRRESEGETEEVEAPAGSVTGEIRPVPEDKKP